LLKDAARSFPIMEISKGAIGILAAVCVVGGAGTAYYATRDQAAPPPATASAAAVSLDPAVTQVEQSEGVVSDATVPSPASPPIAPAAVPAPAPRAAAPSPRARPAGASHAPSPASEPLRPVEESPTPAPALVRTLDPEPVRQPDPPEPKYLDLVLASNSVIGLQVETPVSTDKARVEDEVVARVTRDVRVGDRVAIPAGSKAHGEVTLVEKGGRLKDRARLGVRFTSIVLADGTKVPITTETIYREGESPTNGSAAKIGGAAIGGAILGGILGGGKGAAIGGAIGAGGGSAAVMAGGPKDATLSSGSPVTIRLEEPATVTVEKE
jgi:type IV secretory pathway VirB10-like protein